jgi:hypothetical protein
MWADYPDPPHNPSLEPQASERDDDRLAADRGELAPGPIVEGLRLALAGYMRLDGLGHAD